MLVYQNSLITGGGSFFSQSPAQFSFVISTPTLTGTSPSELFTDELPVSGYLTLTGTGLYTGSDIVWNGNLIYPYFSSDPRHLLVQLTASEVATAGPVTVRVVNPAPGGPSNEITLLVKNRQPAATAISPSRAERGGGPFTLTVNGDKFVSTSVVRWNDQDLPTTFVSSTEIRAEVPASSITTAGDAAITVSSPAPGGGESDPLVFTVVNPAPVLSSIDPESTATLGADFTLRVSGAAFTPDSVVCWNGGPRSTSYVSPTELHATIPASDLVTPGSADITVVTPAPGGGTSEAQTFTITKRTPTITWTTPAPIIAGAALGAAQLNATSSLGGTLVYSPTAGTVLAPGAHTLSVTFTPTDASHDLPGSASVSLTVNNDEPQMLSQPTAQPNPAFVGDEVTFTAQAADFTPLTYLWTFPDGTSATGSTMTRTFSTAGTYNINVTADDGMLGSTTGSTILVVTDRPVVPPPGGGAGSGDQDGDGVPDAMETALGTDPANAGSSPLGAVVKDVLPLQLKKLKLSLAFRSANADTLQLDARAAIAGTATLSNLPVIVDCGGLIRFSRLDSRGNAAVSGGALKLKCKKTKGVILPQDATLTLKLSRTSLARDFADEGLTEPAAPGSRQIKVAVFIGDRKYEADRTLNFSVKNGQGSGR